MKDLGLFLLVLAFLASVTDAAAQGKRQSRNVNEINIGGENVTTVNKIIIGGEDKDGDNQINIEGGNSNVTNVIKIGGDDDDSNADINVDININEGNENSNNGTNDTNENKDEGNSGEDDNTDKGVDNGNEEGNDDNGNDEDNDSDGTNEQQSQYDLDLVRLGLQKIPNNRIMKKLSDQKVDENGFLRMKEKNSIVDAIVNILMSTSGYRDPVAIAGDARSETGVSTQMLPEEAFVNVVKAVIEIALDEAAKLG